MDIKESYEEIKDKLKNLDIVDDMQKIKSTAERLHNISYEPPFFVEVDNFIELDRKGGLNALKDIYNTPDNVINKLNLAKDRSVDKLKIDAMNIFYSEYKLLQQLRMDIPTAWDHINELYEDD